MKISEAKKRADKKWEKTQYRILIRVDKEKESIIKEIASANGETVNEMIKRLIDSEIQKNKKQ